MCSATPLPMPIEQPKERRTDIPPEQRMDVLMEQPMNMLTEQPTEQLTGKLRDKPKKQSMDMHYS